MAKASNVETVNTAWNSTAPLGEFRPYIPESAEKLLNALGAPETDIAGAVYGSHPGGQPVEKLAPLFPKPE